MENLGIVTRFHPGMIHFRQETKNINMIKTIFDKLLALFSEGLVKVRAVFNISANKSDNRQYTGSVHQESKGILSKTNQQVVIHPPNEVPEFHLHLSGSGAKRKIEGHIEKKDSKTLIVENIEIDGSITPIEKQFTKLLPLRDINAPESLFKIPKSDIQVKVVYKTLSGKRYGFTQKMKQSKRTDDFLNVSLSGSPRIAEMK